LALAHSARDNTSQSLVTGAEAAKLAPNSALAHGNYALALFYAGDFRLAAREARAAAQLDPDSVAARVALGQSLLARGDVAGATREAAVAVALDPELPAARYLLGVTEASQRDYSHGRRELETALKLAPDYLAAAAALARLENASGNEARAIEVVTTFQERNGTNSATLSALGLTYFEQGKYRQAIQSLEESVKLNPASAQAQLDLAKAYLFSNRLRDSLETGQKAVELAPGVAQYHAVLGAIADYNNVEGLAERELRTALVLDPQNALARLLLSIRTTDPRVGINTISQSLLTDPSVLRYLAPGGINTEIDLAYTKNTERSQPVFQHLEEGKDRRATVFTSLLHSRLDDKDKPNDRLETTTMAAYGVVDVDTKTRLLGTATNVREKEGRPGLSYSPLGPEDASATTGGTLLQLAGRHRQGLGTVTAGLIYEPFRIVYEDPDNIAFPFANLFPALPFITYDRQTYASRSFVPEVRGDWLLNAEDKAPIRLSAGYARQDADIAVVQRVTSTFPSVVLHQGYRSNVGYMQMAQRPNSRLAYTVLLRGDSLDSRSSRLFAGDFAQVNQHNFYFLPGAMVNYQLDNRTSLRAFANRVRDDVTTVALAPVETRLATEPTAGFRGSNQTSRIFELDLERYLGNGNIFKAFAFHSVAKDLQMGGISQLPVSNAPSVTLNRAKRTGAGVRLERRLNRNLIGSTTLTYSDTSGDAPGEAFDGGPAPYHPRLELLTTMDYIDPHGNKARVRIRHESRYYDDSGVAGFPATGRPTFPSKTVVDLLFSKEPSIHTEYYLNLYNVFNTRQELFYGVPGGSQAADRSTVVRGRGLEIGVALRF
jgi:tetratricopeptide (TPR) repeat protein